MKIRSLGHCIVVPISLTAMASGQQGTKWNTSLGNWFIAANWAGGVPMRSGARENIAEIDNGGLAFIRNPGAEADTLVVTGGIAAPSTLSLSRTGSAPPGTLLVQDIIIADSTGPGSTFGAAGRVEVLQGATLDASALTIGDGSLEGGNRSTATVLVRAAFVDADLIFLGNGLSDAFLNVEEGAGITGRYGDISRYRVSNAAGFYESNASVTITGAGSSWTLAGSGSPSLSSRLDVGSMGTGSLVVSNGGRVSTANGHATIGTNPDARGSVTVTGAGSVWDHQGILFVGGDQGFTSLPGGEEAPISRNGGSGSLRVQAGGLVQASSLIFFSNGVLEVENGSSGVAGLKLVGGGPTPGDGGTFGDMAVGASGSGRTEIRGGGILKSARGFIGFSAGSAGAVALDGAGSRWEAAGSVFVGNGGQGSLEVLGGSVVMSGGRGYLGFAPNANGSARVSGTGSSWTMAANLFIGGDGASPGGSGALLIEDGGRVGSAGTTVYNTGFLQLGADALLSGPLTFLGGGLQTFADITFSNDFTIGAGGLLVYTLGNDPTFSGDITGPGGLNMFFLGVQGTLTLTGDCSFAGPTLVPNGRLAVEGSITSNVTLSNGGTLSGRGTVGSVTVNSGGVVAPGNSAGKLTINGNYHQTSGGILRMEIGGDTAGTGYDQLAISGTAVLDGTLELSLVNGFRPTVGDTFAIIVGSGQTGGFSTVTSTGFDVATNTNDGTVSMTVTAVHPPLRVTEVAFGNGQFVITFSATGGGTYRLERTAALTADWVKVPGIDDITPTEDGSEEFTTSVGANEPTGFFRVRLISP